MSDDTSRGDPRHESLAAYCARGAVPIEHPASKVLTEIAGRERWLAREEARAQAVADIASNQGVSSDDRRRLSLDRWAVELYDDPELAERFLNGLPPEVVALEERRTAEIWDLRRRPVAGDLVVVDGGYRCVLSGRTDSGIALSLISRDEPGAEPLLMHPDEVLSIIARGSQAVEDAEVMTGRLGRSRRNRLMDLCLGAERRGH